MSKPSKQPTKVKANVAALVNNIASKDIAEYEKILLQLRVLKEKGMYSTALQLFKKGSNIIKQQLEHNIDPQLETQLTLAKARYYHYASSIFYELNKHLKAISYSTQALHSVKGILDNSSIEIMRFKEVLAVSYKGMEQYEDALSYFDQIYYGLNVHIKTLQTQKRSNQDEEKKNDNHNKLQTDDDCSLQELQVWKGDITYNIAMIHNSTKQFQKAAKYAKECCIIRNLYQSKSSKQILALMLVAVIVSSPKLAEYKLALDNLEKARSIIDTNSDKQDLKQYRSQIQKLSRTVLDATVRYSKLTNIDLDHYLKTGDRRKQSNNTK